jgi:phage N-6-adenine-methyltransferase
MIAQQLDLFSQSAQDPQPKPKRIVNSTNPKMTTGLFTSDKCEWETPQSFFDQLNVEFQFDLDVCALTENAKCERYFTPEDNGLRQEWRGVCWMNPPYGREIGDWIQKAYESARAGATVVCLIPSRTDTAWWHDYCMRASEVRFVRKRIKFGGSPINAPFPSAVVIFKPGENEPKFSTIDQKEGDAS